MNYWLELNYRDSVRNGQSSERKRRNWLRLARQGMLALLQIDGEDLEVDKGGLEACPRCEQAVIETWGLEAYPQCEQAIIETLGPHQNAYRCLYNIEAGWLLE